MTDSFNASKTESVKINMDFESIRVESVDFESDWTNKDVNVVIEASHKASGLKCVKLYPAMKVKIFISTEIRPSLKYAVMKTKCFQVRSITRYWIMPATAMKIQ